MKDQPKLQVSVKPPTFQSKPLKYKVVWDKKINLTKERAFEFLELKTFQGERNVNESHVQTLFNAYHAGRFMWDHVIIATARCEGVTYRINGQHTCWMRVNLERCEEAMVRWVEYQVPDDEQLRALYSTFDQAKMRTPGHIVKALLTGTEKCADVWPSMLNVLAAGMRCWLYPTNEQKSNAKATDLVALLVSEEYVRTVRNVALFVQSLDDDERLTMRRAAVVAGMLSTFHTTPSKFFEFWQPVAQGTGLADKTDARFQLRRWLETHGQSLRGRSIGKTPTSQEETYRCIIHCWNKWRRGEALNTTVRPPEKRVKPV